MNTQPPCVAEDLSKRTKPELGSLADAVITAYCLPTSSKSEVQRLMRKAALGVPTDLPVREVRVLPTDPRPMGVFKYRLDYQAREGVQFPFEEITPYHAIPRASFNPSMGNKLDEGDFLDDREF